MRLWAIYIFPPKIGVPILFCWRKYVDRSWDYINRSQIHECWNWGWGRAIPRKVIHKWNFPCSASRRRHRVDHRVGRVLSFFSSRQKWDSPTPHPQESVPPPLWLGGGGLHTRWRERGWGSPNSDEGTYTVVLCIYKYFVGLTYWPASLCSLATQFQTRFLESIPRPIAGLKFSRPLLSCAYSY
jgi:hypothetical protein